MRLRPTPITISRACCRGLSLVEQLTVLALAATLLGSGVASMQALSASMVASAASNELLAHLLLARSEAIKRRQRVTLCKSADGAGCADTGAWEQGWILFVDADGDGQRAADEPVLQRRRPLAGSLRVRGNASVERYVAYTPTGVTRLAGGGFQAGTLTVCRQSAEPGVARQIVISASGRPRVQKVQLQACP